MQLQGHHGIFMPAQKPKYETYKSPYGPKSVSCSTLVPDSIRTALSVANYVLKEKALTVTHASKMFDGMV